MLDNYVDKIIHGNCMEAIKDMPDESIDLVVTDPPYGINFMGKEWDKALPPVEAWKECLRVLKPGAFAFIMCIPRQDCLSRMIISLEDAGFMVNFSPIYWTFASGFPKSSNISKLVDKRLGAERKVVGTKQGTYADIRRDEETGQDSLHGGEKAKERPRVEVSITAPASPEAKALEGSYAGCQLKPAVEVILCVMKPLSEKTYLDQALANGKGVTWLDSCKIPFRSDQDATVTYNKNQHEQFNNGQRENNVYGQDKRQRVNYSADKGRFPANILVSDDVLNDGKVTKSTGGSGVASMGNLGNNVYGTYALDRQAANSGGCGDSGSYSRYFSLDAWADKHLPESVNRVFPFMIVPKPSKREKNAGLGEGQQCTHPTVKSIKLMSFLCMLGSREGDVVLDPFCGTGTTCIAAALLKRHYIGIDLDAHWCEIAEKRIAWHLQQQVIVDKQQLDLFNQKA